MKWWQHPGWGFETRDQVIAWAAWHVIGAVLVIGGLVLRVHTMGAAHG